MLTEEDQQNLKQLGVECKQANFPASVVFGQLLSKDPGFGSIVQTVCLNDDGQIDPQEAKLVTWARNFVFRFEPQDGQEAYSLIREGEHS
ncbi:hypothetical protein [Floridanema evergladense]|uniref:Uncharacterized protein n=1 Tax=Floridaenema evergladense BLCC-F167 TaxID=3153639 RepID=A0ABV4WV28_9CYAN